jgi:hypothetical protein
MHHTDLEIVMRYTAKIVIVATLAFAVATPALAGSATMGKAARHEMLMKQKACKKEASEQNFGYHLMKKRAFVKKCMHRV